MSRPTAAPVVRTESERSAQEAASRSLYGVAQRAWDGGRLALVTLVIGIISGFLALGAGEPAHGATEPDLYSGGYPSALAEAKYVGLSSSVASADKILVGVERGVIPSLGLEFQVAEFEQEDEEGHSKGFIFDAPRDTAPVFSRVLDERFRKTVCAFVSRIGDFRKLPRGPPALA